MNIVKKSVREILIFVLLLTYLVPQVSFAGTAKCREVFEQDFDILQVLQGKVGGSDRAWRRFNDRILQNKTPEEIAIIKDIAKNSNRQSWYRRVIVNRLAFQIHRVFTVLHNTNRQNMDLNQFGSWEQLTLQQRRGLLLSELNRWWWEADSPHVVGWSKWLNPSFVIAERLLVPQSESRLEHRTHQLFYHEASLSLWAALFKRFATEIEIFKTVQNNEKGKAKLDEMLVERIFFFNDYKNIYKAELKPRNIRYIDEQIFRAELLIRMLREDRVVNKDQAKEVTEYLVMDTQVYYDYRYRQVRGTFLNTTAGMVNLFASMAFYGMLAGMLGSLMEEDEDPNLRSIEIQMNELMGLPADHGSTFKVDDFLLGKEPVHSRN